MHDENRVVVIGTGPAGAMAAWQLAQNGIPVTILESGTGLPEGLLLRAFGQNFYRKKPSGNFGSDCGADYHRSPDPKTVWFMAFMLGGLSNHWTGAVPRFAAEDFTEGARLHEKYRWPLGYDELVPYYERAERLMGIVAGEESFPTLPAGYVDHVQHLPSDWGRVARAASDCGHGLTALPLADGPPFLALKQGTAFNSYASIVSKILSMPHVEMRVGAHVLRLEWSGQDRRVNRVVYRDAMTGREQSCAAKAVVVCAGALNSTRLLFASTSADFPEGLGNTHGVLGGYLHDHPREWWAFETDEPLTVLKPAAYMTRGSYEEGEPLMGCSWTIGTASTLHKVLGLARVKARQFGVQVFGTTVPTEEGRVRPLRDSTDNFGMPRLEIDLTYDAASKKLMEDSRPRLFEVLERAGIRGTLTQYDPDQLALGSSVHYGGTARMHADPAFGMLDGYNRVHGVPNVLVCDAASFTTGPEKNPTLTAMALSARACDHLSSELRAQ